MDQTTPERDKIRLIKSTAGSALVAAVLLVLFVLPAEYAIDPTGFGRLIGVNGLSAEASSRIINNPDVGENPGAQTQFHTSYDEPLTFLEVAIELVPFGQVEYKFHMREGARLSYVWKTSDGLAYSDLHGHTIPPGETEEVVVQYLETQEGESESGAFTTPFGGEHGWYFLNLEDRDQTIILKVSGVFDKHELIDLGSQLDGPSGF